MRTHTSFLAALLLASSPVSAQDFLAPLQNFVEDLVPQRQTATPQSQPKPPPPPTPAADRPAAEENPPPLPRPRPEEGQGDPETLNDDGDAEADDDAASAPKAEPLPAEPEQPEIVSDRVYQTACPALLAGLVVGEMLPPIEDGICEERSPLLVTALRANGREIGLTTPLTTNCNMAGALADWAGEVDRYAAARLDSPLETIITGSSFICRNRYSAADGFVSEHGFANAVDVTGFSFEGGATIGVKADWPAASESAGRLLRQAHGAACGRFTTVLGPEANADHEDHFHLDLGCHGQSCTAQICE